MAVRPKDVHPPIPLRAHRPKQADAQASGVPSADVQPSYHVETADIPKRVSWIQQNLHQVGMGMLFMLAVWVATTSYVLPFVQDKLDHWNCGTPPGICQFDFNVGHGGTSHFLTQYWHNHVIVIETSPTDARNTKVYSQQVSLVGGQNTARIVSLKTDYIARHPIQGKPDLVASVTGFALPLIFYNTGSGFSTEEPHAANE